MQYDEYKDSGIAWLGQIPEHWEVVPFKRWMNIKNGQDYKNIADDDGIYPVIGSGGPFASCSEYLYDGESVLLGRKGTIDKPLYYHGRFWTIDTMFYTIPKRLCVIKYIYFQCLTIPFQLYGTSTALPSMTQTDLGLHEICLPPLSEQESIVRYLEERCGEVDQRIERAKRRVELLQELKQNIITEAVTRGLDHTVLTRDSGIAWLGQIPEHWEVCRLKGCIEFINGYAFSSDAFTSGGEMPVVRIGDIVSGRISYEDAVMVDIYPNLNRFKVLPNDILLAMSGATVGKLGLVNEGDKGYINQRVGILRSKLYKYIYYALNTPAFMEYVYLTSEGSAQPNISTFSIRNYELPLPPLSEQESIVRYLEERCGEVDQRIERAKRRVELLQELKQSIITEAVTGKIKVG